MSLLQNALARVGLITPPPDVAAMAAELRGNPLENPAIPLSGASLVDLFGEGYGATASARLVNADTALRQTVVFTCVRVLSETIAALPLNVYKRSPSKVLEPTHPLYRTLHDEASGMLTSFVFREVGMMHSNVFGNWYALISRLPGGDVNLLLMYPPLVTPRVTAAGLKYDVRMPEGMITFDQKDVLHVPGLSFDGYRGISATLHAAKEAIGVALAAEEHTARFFSNGARVAGVLQTDMVLNDEVVNRVRTQWTQLQAGLANAYRTAILEQGLKYQSTVMQSDQAELTLTRQFQVEDLCRPFRVPPMFAGEYGKSTYSNMEQSDIHFAKHCIRPICRKVEAEINRKLFADNKGEYFCEFDLEELTQGDFETRMRGFATAVQGAIYKPNEVRAKLGMPPATGGDELYIQQNMAELDKLTKTVAPNAAKTDPTKGNDNAA